MPDDSRVLRWGGLLLRVLIALNLAFATGFAIAMVASFVFGDPLVVQIARKYAGSVDAVAALWGMRALALVGVLISWPIDRILRALASVVATVRAGDPFAPSNARSAATIGWGLLAIQLIDLGFGAVVLWIAWLGADVVEWQPSLAGWLSALVAFVLARVFAAGARLRDDLAGTI